MSITGIPLGAPSLRSSPTIKIISEPCYSSLTSKTVNDIHSAKSQINGLGLDPHDLKKTINDKLDAHNKEISEQTFNILNGIKNKESLEGFIKEQLKLQAKEANLTLKPGSEPELKTTSKFNSDNTTIYFRQPCTNDKVLRLTIKNTDVNSLNTETRRLIGEAFKIGEGLRKQAENDLDTARSAHQKDIQKFTTNEKVKDGKINELTKALQEKDDTILDQKNKFGAKDTELKKLKNEFSSLNDKNAEINKDILDKDKQLKVNSETITQLNCRLLGATEELSQAKHKLSEAHDKLDNTISKTEAQEHITHISTEAKGSYWPAALVGLATAMSAIFMVVKGVALGDAKDNLEDAYNDDKYIKQGEDAANAAVTKEVEQDRLDYLTAKANGEDTSEIAARYTIGADGQPTFSSTSLTDAGKAAMSGISESARAQGIQAAKTEAIAKAEVGVEQAKESLGLVSGMTLLLGIIATGLGLYTASKNKHVDKTQKAANDAIASNSQFDEPKKEGLYRFTSKINNTMSRFRTQTSKE